MIARRSALRIVPKLGVGSRPGSPEEFGAFIVRENQKWTAVARSGNIKVD